MPSVSDAQRAFMRRAASDPEFAKKRGIDPKVAQQFVDEDELLEAMDDGTLLKDVGLECASLRW